MNDRVLKIMNNNVKQIGSDTADLRDCINDLLPTLNMLSEEKELHEQLGIVSENLDEAIYYLEKAKEVLEEGTT